MRWLGNSICSSKRLHIECGIYVSGIRIPQTLLSSLLPNHWIFWLLALIPSETWVCTSSGFRTMSTNRYADHVVLQKHGQQSVHLSPGCPQNYINNNDLWQIDCRNVGWRIKKPCGCQAPWHAIWLPYEQPMFNEFSPLEGEHYKCQHVINKKSKGPRLSR